METASNPDDIAMKQGHPRNIRPKASAWLWRPWHAKLWWAGMVTYWVSKCVSLYVPSFAEFYTSAFAGYLNVLFFPMTALLILGIGFAQAWFAASNWEVVEPTEELMFPKRSVGGMRDPCADPLDPRSGPLHWRYLESGN